MKLCDVLSAVTGFFKRLTSGSLFTRTVSAQTVSVSTAVPDTLISPANVPAVATAGDKKTEFIKALRIAVLDGFEPLILYTQCYHETGNFKKIIGKYNYAGLKCPVSINPPIAGWDGTRLLVTTHETINGVSRKVIDAFCDFSSAEFFMSFYIYQIKRLYREAYAERTDATHFYHWLTRGKNRYATDLSYTDKLQKLYADLRANGEYAKMNAILENANG